jgi:hypothetical protein
LEELLGLDRSLGLFVRILPDEETDAAEEGDHQSDCADTGEDYGVDEHGCLLVLRLVLMASE